MKHLEVISSSNPGSLKLRTTCHKVSGAEMVGREDGVYQAKGRLLPT